MGQYGGERESKDEGYVIRFKSYSKRHSGKPRKQVYQIRIPIRILNELKRRGLKDYYKILLKGPTQHIYYWKYTGSKDSEREDTDRVISIAGLREGEYNVEIYPYNLESFVDEYNNFIKNKYSKMIKLEIKDNNLILKVDNYEFITKEWRFEKLFGGAIGIIAQYKTGFSNPKIIFKIRDGNADIRLIQAPFKKSTRGYKILDLEPSTIGLKIKYITGSKRIKRTYVSRLSADSYYQIDIAPHNLKIRRYKKYTTYNAYTFYPIKDAIHTIDILWLIANNLKIRDRELHNSIKGRLGVKIAKAFLKIKKRTNEILEETDIKKEYEKLRRLPDLAIFLPGGRLAIYEVKLVSYSKYMNRAFNKATRQIKGQIDHLNKLGIEVSKYGIIIINYIFKEERGYIFFKEYRRD